MKAKEVAEIVKSNRNVAAVGGRSKPGCLCDLTNGFTTIDLTQFSGIIEYEPDEYTLTAKAGTPLKTLIEAVEKHNQYLPFDPMWAAEGATIGGTVAANTSGSGRLRYGGIRDFILGIRFVDGQGNIVRGGGKVVKNASGFDLPKFMVGSLGRYGILTEITLKVFPKPAAYRTLELEFGSLADALNCTFALANQPFEIDALDFKRIKRDEPITKLWIRAGGLAESLPDRVKRLTEWLVEKTDLQNIGELEDESIFWDDINRVEWASDEENLVKIPLPPKQLRRLDQTESISSAHYFSAGNVALVTSNDLEDLGEALTEQGLNGLVLKGEASRPILGKRSWTSLAQRVKGALDPDNKFLGV